MPRSRINKLVTRRKRSYRINRRRKTMSPRSKRSGVQKMAVHRRLVLFPDTDNSSWLSKLSWFAGVALKLFVKVSQIEDDLTAKTVTVGSGSVMLLGPGDFASCSPYAVPISTTNKQEEVICLKTFSFERVALHHVSVTIVPSVDLGSRGGMYATLLIPIDSADFQLNAASSRAKEMMTKYSADYDDIIRHPKAKLGPVTKTLTHQISLKATPHNVRVQWANDTGFTNAYPSCVLIVAFSDLASEVDNVDTGYSPAKSLFEVHLKADISFHEPADLVVRHDENGPSMSNYTPKILMTNSKSINNKLVSPRVQTLVHFGESCDYVEPLSLDKVPLELAKRILEYHGKPELIKKLEDRKRDQEIGVDFDMCKV